MNSRLAVLTLLVLIFAPFAVLGAAERYRLEGEVRAPGGGAFLKVRPYVVLEAVKEVWLDRTSAGVDGKFVFEELRPGKYVLNVLVPGVGSVKKTIVIAASQADERGVVEIGVSLGPESSQMAQVSAAELAIPKEAARAYQRALDSLGRGDKSQAVRHLERACDLAPDYANAWNRLGTIAFKSGKYRQAETYFRTALERDPSFYPALVNLGGALLSQGRRREAWVVNLKAVEDEPEDPLAHAQLGATYLELEQLDQADKHLKIAKFLDPAHFSNPQLLLAKIHGLRGDYPALASELKEFLEIQPDYPDRAQLELLIQQAESAVTE